MMKPTLDKTNPEYFNLVKQRMEEKQVLECYVQTNVLLSTYQNISSVLDIGCASGYLYYHINTQISSYYGIDISEKFIKYGRLIFEQSEINNACLTNVSFESFSIEKKFDVIVCLGLFYVFPNFHELLWKMMQQARQGILIRALFEEQTSYRFMPEKEGSNFMTYYNIYSFKEIENFADKYGWSVIWHQDNYMKSLNNYYETAGVSFPFCFLELKPK